MAIAVPKPKKNNKHFNFFSFGLGKEKDFFLENLSLMLESNMPLVSALEALSKEIVNIKFKKIVGQIQEDVSNGLHLWLAFEKANFLPEYSLSLIRIGEESGKLVENLKVINQQQHKNNLLRSRIKTAMLYPSFVTFLMFVIGIGISWFILPRLANVFINLKLELPLTTRLLIILGGFLQKYGIYFIPSVIILGLFFFYFIFLFPKTKILGQKIVFALPGAKALIQQVEISKFGYMLSTMLSSGVPIVDAIGLLEDVSSFQNYKNFYSYLKESLLEGNSFKASFKNYKNINLLIPIHLQEMIVASEQTGKLEEVFLKLAKNYEEKSEETAKNLSVIIEPVLLVVVWVGVVLVALSVVLPLYKLVGGLQSSVSGGQVTKQTEVKTKPDIKNKETKPVVKGEHVFLETKIKISQEVTPYLKVREKPESDSKVIFKVKKDEVYVTTNYVLGWFQITISPEMSGWISEDFIEILND